MEAMVKAMGFKSLEEFNHMVASVDITTADKMAAFKKWQAEDGTKAGLEKLMGVIPAVKKVKKEKVKEYKGFKVGEIVVHKSNRNSISYGECTIKAFDLTYGEDIEISIETYGEDDDGHQSGYTAMVELSELRKREV